MKLLASGDDEQRQRRTRPTRRTTKTLRRPGPVREPAAEQGGDDDHARHGQGAEEELPRDVVLGAAELLQQVVGLVGGQERVGQDEQEPAGERPREVGVPPRVDVERAGELPQRPGRLVRRGQPAVVQRGGEEQDEEPADRRTGPGTWRAVLPVNSWTTKVPLTEAMGRQMPRTPATRPRCATGTWSGSTATRAASSALKNTCAMHQPTRTTAMLGASATTRMPSEPPTQADHHPRVVACPAGEVVRSLSLPKNGLANMASSAPTPATSARLLGACSSADERVDLQRQADQQRREEQQEGADVRQRVQRDEPPSDGADRAPVWRRRTGRCHRRIRWWCSGHQSGASAVGCPHSTAGNPGILPCYTCGRAAESGSRGERCWQALCSRPSCSSLGCGGERWRGRG